MAKMTFEVLFSEAGRRPNEYWSLGGAKRLLKELIPNAYQTTISILYGQENNDTYNTVIDAVEQLPEVKE
ncbi:hypothetical protein FNH22_03690 [Fulvivirga sp. M361]|uniref:hypothetical protein n=1 Tax=Fulvivirga sp. M361 TaxID=2594266 RepID=UPI00117B1515|nr:hypothetical protein [Fulvivirga sp. M361]TRX61885.1 hypothetical protein FNH22_03690 [Fulvivirga sp. M361]